MPAADWMVYYGSPSASHTQTGSAEAAIALGPAIQRLDCHGWTTPAVPAYADRMAYTRP